MTLLLSVCPRRVRYCVVYVSALVSPGAGNPTGLVTRNMSAPFWNGRQPSQKYGVNGNTCVSCPVPAPVQCRTTLTWAPAASIKLSTAFVDPAGSWADTGGLCAPNSASTITAANRREG